MSKIIIETLETSKSEFFYLTYVSIPTPIFFYLGTPSTSVPTSNPSCSTSSAVANAAELQLTDREKARLDELFLASRALVEPVEHERDVIRYFILVQGYLLV